MSDFWVNLQLPINNDEEALEEGVELLNPVIVAEHFVSVTQITTELTQRLERFIGKLGQVEKELRLKRRELKNLRREILASHFDKIKASASSEAQEAFLWRCAKDDSRDSELGQLEDRIYELEEKQNTLKRGLSIIKGRGKLLEHNMDYLKQYLDHEKLETRVRMKRD